MKLFSLALISTLALLTNATSTNSDAELNVNMPWDSCVAGTC